MIHNNDITIIWAKWPKLLLKWEKIKTIYKKYIQAFLSNYEFICIQRIISVYIYLKHLKYYICSDFLFKLVVHSEMWSHFYLQYLHKLKHNILYFAKFFNESKNIYLALTYTTTLIFLLCDDLFIVYHVANRITFHFKFVFCYKLFFFHCGSLNCNSLVSMLIMQGICFCRCMVTESGTLLS